MKRHGLILLLVALMALPVMSMVVTGCATAPDNATTNISAEDAEAREAAARKAAEEAERARLEAEKQRMMEEKRMADMKAAEEQKAREMAMAREEAAMFAQKQVFLNTYAHFDFDKYDIRPDAAEVLKAKAEYMIDHPGLVVEIQGHCDERGTEEYNLALGDRRAKAAKKYMVSQGVRAELMSTISFGEERPLNPGHNEEAWAENRRAQFVIIGGE